MANSIVNPELVDPDDEIASIRETAQEAGLPEPSPGSVARRSVSLPDGRVLSALVWGDDLPELVLLHGGAQNAHTWDAVALGLQRPLVAFDLAGHGHSSWRPDAVYDPALLATDVVHAMAELAPSPVTLVGMSLGGLTSIALAAHHPELVHHLVVVDVTPGTNLSKSAADPSQNANLIYGQQSYGSFDELYRRVSTFRPSRSESRLRRALRHNARQTEDGRWVWRHHYGNSEKPELLDFTSLWDDVSALRMPTMLVRGDRSAIVDDADTAEFVRRMPGTRVELVGDSGHSVQGDQAADLTRLIAGFIALPS